ncbi:MAG: polyisoprenoid-binding protein YceI, partial [Cyclobacteriaceae bacterium]
MTKNFTNSFIFTLAITVLFTACGGGTTKTETANTETVATETTYTVDATSSIVAWIGEVAGVYGHNGVIKIASGSVSAKGDQITGGTVTIDMTTIVPLDSASFSAEHPASDLVGHLATGDFFLTEEFPTATFVIKSFEGTKLVGDLTVKGITKEET